MIQYNIVQIENILLKGWRQNYFILHYEQTDLLRKSKVIF